MFPDLWSISKTQAVAANFAWWIPACFLTDLLISVIKINAFCNKAAEETPHLWLMNDSQGDWCREKQEMKFSFILYLLSSFQMWKHFCFLQQRSTTQTTTADVESKQWLQLSFKNGVLNKEARIEITEFSTELSPITCLAKFHFPANFSQFYDTLLKSFCRTDTRKTSRKTNKR